MLPMYVKFEDPEDPEKPCRFEWGQNYFNDCYYLYDRETRTRVEIYRDYLLDKKRLPHETDKQFVIRIVREGLEKLELKQLKAGN